MNRKHFKIVGFVLVALVVSFFVIPEISEAAIQYDSMIAATDFDTAKADVKTTASGILGIAFTLMVIGLILAVIFR